MRHGEGGARFDGQLHREVVVRVDEREAREGGELGERVDEDGDKGEGNLEVLVPEEKGRNHCGRRISWWENESMGEGRTEVDVPAAYCTAVHTALPPALESR
jgi:hypothetical protein